MTVEKMATEKMTAEKATVEKATVETATIGKGDSIRVDLVQKANLISAESETQAMW